MLGLTMPLAHAEPALNLPTPPRSPSVNDPRIPSQNGAKVQLNAQGLHVASNDGRHRFSFTPFIQFAHHQMLNPSPDGLASGTRIEHVRPIVVGQYNELVDYIFILQITADPFKLRGHGLTARSRGGSFFEIEEEEAKLLGARGLSTGISWFLADGLRVQADYNWTRFHADHHALNHRQEHLLSVGLTAGY